VVVCFPSTAAIEAFREHREAWGKGVLTMSVTIYWRPASDTAKSFKGGTSSVLKALQDTFGQTITSANIPELRAMARAANDPFYDEVAAVVERVGDIEVWGEWYASPPNGIEQA
jgi:hypothetical protein